MFQQDPPSPDNAKSADFAGPIEVDISQPEPVTIFQTEAAQIRLSRGRIQIPDAGKITTEALQNLPRNIGATNGAWLGLVHNGTPTVSTFVVLQDFVAEWEEEDPGQDSVTSGMFVPIYRTAQLR
ncbi:hypothetical protein ACWEGE_22955 [Amycolatopsis sp. NPDC004747]